MRSDRRVSGRETGARCVMFLVPRAAPGLQEVLSKYPRALSIREEYK